MLLPLALTIPAVTEKSKLKGDPIATTQSPTLNESLSPTLTFGSLSPSIFKTARSERASTPIISATYSTEVLRAAYLAINQGQVEAAKALGLKKIHIFFKIISPQVLRHAIPGLGNVWQVTLKDTSLISVTGLVEIMRQSYIAAGSTRDPLFFYSFAAVLYLLLTFFSMRILNKLEVKYSRRY